MTENSGTESSRKENERTAVGEGDTDSAPGRGHYRRLTFASENGARYRKKHGSVAWSFRKAGGKGQPHKQPGIR